MIPTAIPFLEKLKTPAFVRSKAGVISIKKRRGECTTDAFSRPALSLEGERSDTQAGLLAYSHRLPLLPSLLPVDSWGRLLLTVTGSHRICTGFPIHP